MKKIILGIAFVFATVSGVNANSDVEIINNMDLIEIAEQTETGPSDCVGFARNTVLGYAEGTGMDTSTDSPEYDYLMGMYHMLYRNCLEDIGYLR